MSSLKNTRSIEEKKTGSRQLPDIRPVDKKSVPKKADSKASSGRKTAVATIGNKKTGLAETDTGHAGGKKGGFSDFVRNKYAVGSVILLVVIIGLVVVALRPVHSEEPVEAAVDESGDIIYIIDEQGNKVAAPATESDSIIMQNEKEEEDPTVLSYNPDTREGYMNNCIFLGDSRTVAMVSYGYISDANALAKVGISHWQVSSTVFTQNSGSRFTLTDYLRAHSEPVIYVCYGVNGMNGLSEEKYESSYEELVDKIVSLAGDRKVVLMSIWPVDDFGRYRGSVKNEWVDKYNTFLFDMAKRKGLYYLNIASALKDENGSIKKEYDSGDGLHYKSSAYKDILEYIIHHPVPGVSDEGEFVVHYVKPRGEYKEIMTETPALPQNTQLEADDYTFEIPSFPIPGQEPQTQVPEGQGQPDPEGQANPEDGENGVPEEIPGEGEGNENPEGEQNEENRGEGEQPDEHREETPDEAQIREYQEWKQEQQQMIWQQGQ